MDKFGLSKNTILTITNLFNQYPKINEVIIFGSRANGTHKNSSDIDFAISGENIDFKFIQHLSAELDELPTPFMFDVLAYNADLPEALKNNIDTNGKVFYKKAEL